MADPQQVLAQRVHDAIVASFGPDFGDADPLIRPSSFADFQANVALPLGKRLGRPPREVAAELAARLDVADMCAEPEVSGPGFINFSLRDDWIAAQATQMLGDPRLGLAPTASPADGGGGVLLAERGQGDARRALAHHHRRRRHRARPGVRRAPGDQGQPRRRLGHPVRHADRAPARRRRGLRRSRAAAHRPERLLPGGPAHVRQSDPAIRRARAQAGGGPAGRRPGHAAACGRRLSTSPWTTCIASTAVSA